MPDSLCKPAAVAQQIERNRRISRGVGRNGTRGGRPHKPACFSRTGTGLRGNPGHQDGCAGRFCSKAKTAACRQVQRARVTPEFDQNPGEGGTSRAFQTGLKHRRCIPALHEDDARRIKTELAQARWIRRAPLAAEEILSYPEKRSQRQPQCQGQHHSGCLGCVSFCRGIKLMNRRPPDHQARGYRFRMSARGRCICGHRALQFTICSYSGDWRPGVKGADPADGCSAPLALGMLHCVTSQVERAADMDFGLLPSPWNFRQCAAARRGLPFARVMFFFCS
jgi:hypothetical protein